MESTGLPSASNTLRLLLVIPTTRTPMKTLPLLFALVATHFLPGTSTGADRPTDRPNIVILFADDLGYGDLSSYGCPDIKTPAIDAIGRAGVRFTRFYSNAPECSPSRTALLTGRYQQRVGGLECAIGLANVGRYDEAEWLQQRGELGLPTSEITLPRLFNDAGYTTAMFGKWHLGYDPKFSPKKHGFQESLVVLGGGTDYVLHTEPDGGNVMRQNDEPADLRGYLTDIFADRAIELIGRQHTRPYFLYVPFNAPHNPYQGPKDGPAPVPWPKGTREVYRSMVEHLDKRIGDIVAAVNKSPSGRNTLLVFLSDNGAPQPGSNQPLRGFKSSVWEGGIRVPCLIKWPAVIPTGGESTQVALNMDLTATFLAAAKIAPPRTAPLDGVNLLPGLQGDARQFSRTVFWRYKRAAERRTAVRDGDYKLMIDSGEKTLVNLAQDESEKENLAAAMPEKVAELEAKIIAWEKDVAAPRLRDFPASAATPEGRKKTGRKSDK